MPSFGWLYRPPDSRNYTLDRILPKRAVLPASFSLMDEGLTAPIRDQSSEGSCTGHAYYAMMAELKNVNRYADVSPRHIYNGARELEGRLSEEGAYTEDLLKYGLHTGVCRNVTWPYVAQARDMNDSPSKHPTAIQEAPQYAILSYAQLNQSGQDVMDNIKQCLYVLRSPVLIGIPWPESWMTSVNGDCSTPDLSESVAGGHAIAIVGWDDSTRRFQFQNSWGTFWGKKGFGTFTYDSLAYFNQYGWDCFKSTISTEPPEPHNCPEGEHWDLAKQECVPDKPPAPDCNQKYIEGSQKCADNYLVGDNPDVYGWLVCEAKELVKWYYCTFPSEAKQKLSIVKNKKKKQVTITVKEV